MKKCLITGASGSIGIKLINELLVLNEYEIIAVDLKSKRSIKELGQGMNGALADLVFKLTGEVVDVITFKTTMLITAGIGILFYTVASTLLLLSIRNNGQYFKKSKKLFITGLVFSIICSPLSVSSVLLYVSLALKDDEIVEVKDGVVSDETKAEVEDIIYDERDKKDFDIKGKITEYKRLKEQGIISDKEYKIMVIKYIRKLRDDKKITEEQFESLLTKLI